MKYKSEIVFEQLNMVQDIAETIGDDDLTTHERFVLIMNAVSIYNEFLRNIYDLEGGDVPEEKE